MKLHRCVLYYVVLTADYYYNVKTVMLHRLKKTSRAGLEPTIVDREKNIHV